MAGIERYVITDNVDGQGAWRFYKSQARWLVAEDLYRQIWPTLEEGREPIFCDLTGHQAGYDSELGIDVNLRHTNGLTAGLQEKFLYTKYKTVTVEYMQDWRKGIQGDWFKIRAQFYFVAYDREHATCQSNKNSIEQEMITRRCTICNRPFTFQDWIMLNWPNVQEQTNLGNIKWDERRNWADGARASFRFVHFDSIPDVCIVARSDTFGERQLKMAFSEIL